MDRPTDILIVDDEEIIRELIAEDIHTSIKENPFKLYLANDGLSGLEKINNLNPQIVITDIKMPKMSGLEMVQKAREFRSDALFVVLTGHASKETIVQFLKYGVFDYLEKPVEIESLSDTITRALNFLSLKNTIFGEIKSLLENKEVAKEEISQILDLFQSLSFNRYRFQLENLK